MSIFGLTIWIVVSNKTGEPCWIYCPNECKSVENVTDPGNNPFLSFPSEKAHCKEKRVFSGGKG